MLIPKKKRQLGKLSNEPTGTQGTEDFFQQLFRRHSSIMLLIEPEQGGIVDANTAATEFYGYPVEVLRGMKISDINTLSEEQIHAERQKALHDQRNYFIFPHRLRSGEIRTVEVYSSAIDSVAGRLLFSIVHDITERKMAEQLIWEQANFDSLTDLPNRSMFYNSLETALRKTDRSGHGLGLMFIDLDNFKEVNDTLGHSIGDSLLRDTAQRLLSCVRDSDTVARLGGDEFTIILEDVNDHHILDRIASKILQKLSEPFQLGHERFYLSASIGITCYPHDGRDIDTLLKNADQAMYVAKTHGRNRYRYFSQSMQAAALARKALIDDMRGALSGSQFALHFQPIVNMKTGAIYKGEALIRWNHPARGLISPNDFIPVAEKTGMIVDIGDWVFREATRQLAAWRASHCPTLQISINASPAQFQSEGFSYREWIDHLRELNLPGESVVVEITEGLLMSASANVSDQLLNFRDSGMQVALDDFGTGFSSLSYLRKFDIDYLKIDQSFVQNLSSSSDDMVLCEAIIVMAHKLGIKVIAEGVETVEQRDILRASGCDYGQGFYFSAAVTPDEFSSLLRSA